MFRCLCLNLFRWWSKSIFENAPLPPYGRRKTFKNLHKELQQTKSDKYNVYEYFEPRLDTLATVPNCQERADLKYVTSDTVLSVRARSQYPSPSPPRPNWGVKNGLKKLETKFGEIDM